MKIKPIVYGIFGIVGAVAVADLFGFNLGYTMLDQTVMYVLPFTGLNYLWAMFNKKGEDLVSVFIKQ